MTDTLATGPTPVEVPAQGGTLDITGVDANGFSSVLGLTSPTLTLADPASEFTFTPSADGLSATIVPNGTTPATATVTFTAGTTLADGTAGEGVTAEWAGEILPGNAVAVAVNFTPNPAPVPEAAAADAPAEPAAS